MDRVTPLEAQRLYRFFRTETDEVIALHDVSIAVGRGEMVAVVGPSGSGKSTLIACLAGLDDPDGGRVLVAGHRLSHRPERERAPLRARHIGLVAQHRNLIDHLNVRQNVALTMRIARAKGTPDEYLDRLGLADRAHSWPAQLSGGEEARVGVAAAVASRPDVVLADEPTAEVDRAAEAQVLELLRELRDGGTAVLVVTHSDAVASAADRTLRLRDGRLDG